MDWRARALAAFPDTPQKMHRVRTAITELDGAVGVLASMGFPLHVVEGPAPAAPLEWPKAVFHLRSGERVVACQAELDELGDGWFPTMEEARHAAGMTKQMERGGIFRQDLPAPLGLIPQPEVRPHDSQAARVMKEQFISKMKRNGRAAGENG